MSPTLTSAQVALATAQDTFACLKARFREQLVGAAPNIGAAASTQPPPQPAVGEVAFGAAWQQLQGDPAHLDAVATALGASHEEVRLSLAKAEAITAAMQLGGGPPVPAPVGGTPRGEPPVELTQPPPPPQPILGNQMGISAAGAALLTSAPAGAMDIRKRRATGTDDADMAGHEDAAHSLPQVAPDPSHQLG